MEWVELILVISCIASFSIHIFSSSLINIFFYINMLDAKKKKKKGKERQVLENFDMTILNPSNACIFYQRNEFVLYIYLFGI